MNTLFTDYKSLFEESPQINLLCQPDLSIQAVSNSFLHATKTTRETIIGRTVFEVFTDSRGDINAPALSTLRASLQKVIQSGQADSMPAQQYSLHLPGKFEGCVEKFYWKSLNTPLWLGSEHLLYVLVTIEDISNQLHSGEYGKDLQLEEAHQLYKINRIEDQISSRSVELNDAGLQLKAVSDELQKLTYITSHDLKAHLRGINTLTQWISKGFGDKLDEDGQKQLSLLNNRIHRMFKLLEGVLTYSSVKAEDKKNREMVNMNCLLQDVLDAIEVPENIEVKIENPLPTLNLGKQKLYQVFMQLLLNAIKFNDKPKGLIKINAKEEETDWIISVQDNGKGIAPKYHHKIFQLFQTLETENTNTNTGAGLAIVKKIVTGCGGRVWLESKEGQGCKFYFTIVKD